MIGALANHLWQSTIFAVVVALLTAALRKNRAHVRYCVWFVASLKFFVPFSLLMNLGSRLASASAAKVFATPAVPAVSRAMEQLAQPFSNVFPSATSSPQSAVDWAPAIVLGVWVCGFAAIALTQLRGWRRIRAAVRASTPSTISRACLPASIEIRSSPGLLEPSVVGLWRPILLVPAGMEEHLTPPQLEAVLAHELCHIRRRDNVTAAIHMIVEAVFWFHPLAWWIGARLVEERERACDEHVLRLFGEPRAYAEGILNVCKLYVESPLACVAGVTGSNLETRIEDIMIIRIGLRLSFARKTALALTATLALAAPIVAGMATAPLQAQVPASVKAKESALKQALFQMRDAIDRYYADKKQYPKRLDSLASDGYIKRIPTDPLTGRAHTWRTLPSKPDASHPAAAPGIYDVKSGSKATAIDGTKYSDW